MCSGIEKPPHSLAQSASVWPERITTGGRWKTPNCLPLALHFPTSPKLNAFLKANCILMSVLFDEVVRRKASENTRSRITILGDKAVLVNTLTWVIFLVVMENTCWSVFKVLSELPDDWQHAFERFSFSWEACSDSPAGSFKGWVSCNFLNLLFCIPY